MNIFRKNCHDLNPADSTLKDGGSCVLRVALHGFRYGDQRLGAKDPQDIPEHYTHNPGSPADSERLIRKPVPPRTSTNVMLPLILALPACCHSRLLPCSLQATYSTNFTSVEVVEKHVVPLDAVDCGLDLTPDLEPTIPIRRAPRLGQKRPRKQPRMTNHTYMHACMHTCMHA